MRALLTFTALSAGASAALVAQRAHAVRLSDDESRFLTAALCLGCIWVGIASLVARGVLA